LLDLDERSFPALAKHVDDTRPACT
jgi:hypothetical protein